MYWVRTARRIFDRDHQDFFARKVCHVFRHQLCDLSLLCYQRASHETRQRQNYFCERHKMNLSLDRRHFNASYLMPIGRPLPLAWCCTSFVWHNAAIRPVYFPYPLTRNVSWRYQLAFLRLSFSVLTASLLTAATLAA